MPGTKPGDLRITGSRGETWIDVWVPDYITQGPNWHNWGNLQYTYTGGDYFIYMEGRQPILGPTLKDDF
jgi:hypothetical protein